MKEEKVCINKTIALLAAVTVLILGVVVFTNYVNTQNIGTTPKATSNSQYCMYGGQQLRVGSSVTIGTQTFSLDTDMCVLVDGARMGVQCPYSEPTPGVKELKLRGVAYDKSAACVSPTTAPRSVCEYGGVTLTAYDVTSTPPAAMPTTKVGAQGLSLGLNQCILIDGKKIGKKCDVTTGFRAESSSDCTPATGGLSACLYGGKTLTTTAQTFGAQQIMLDGSNCILVDNQRIGKLCDSTTGYLASSNASCAAPTGAPRSACVFLGSTLPTAVPTGAKGASVNISGKNYALETGTNCIVDGDTGYNTGWYCDPTTFAILSKGSTLCPP